MLRGRALRSALMPHIRCQVGDSKAWHRLRDLRMLVRRRMLVATSGARARRSGPRHSILKNTVSGAELRWCRAAPSAVPNRLTWRRRAGSRLLLEGSAGAGCAQRAVWGCGAAGVAPSGRVQRRVRQQYHFGDVVELAGPVWVACFPGRRASSAWCGLRGGVCGARCCVWNLGHARSLNGALGPSGSGVGTCEGPREEEAPRSILTRRRLSRRAACLKLLCLRQGAAPARARAFPAPAARASCSRFALTAARSTVFAAALPHAACRAREHRHAARPADAPQRPRLEQRAGASLELTWAPFSHAAEQCGRVFERTRCARRTARLCLRRERRGRIALRCVRTVCGVVRDPSAC